MKRIALFALTVSAASPAAAFDIYVTSDSGAKDVAEACVLRDAIAYANSGVPAGGCGTLSAVPTANAPTTPGVGNRIFLPPGATITLTGVDDLDRNVGLPAISTVLTINGNGSTIQRDPAIACVHDGMVEPGEFGLIYNESGLSLNELTLRGGCADGTTGYGGAVNNAGRLTLGGVVLDENYAQFSGGAVYSAGYAGTDGQVSVWESVATANVARDGGAFFVGGSTGALSVNASVFELNSASQYFSGGALHLSIAAQANIVNSTFAMNSAGSGGAIQSEGQLALSFVTLAENSTSSGSGGALQIGASGAVQQLTLKSNVFADNAGDGVGNCQFGGGNVTLAGANLSSDGSCSGFSLASTAAGLQPLAAYGRTALYALSPGSPAVDGAVECSDANGNSVAQDQRGQSRPQGAACDLGAFELDDRVFAGTFEPIIN
jgi:predicted outer membrane repeat protein